MISINEAAKIGVDRLRRPIWANPMDHLKIDIINDQPGPWVHLYAPFNKECNSRDPVNILALEIDFDSAEWESYEGPLSDSAEYKAAVAEYDGCLKG